ncbi:MAG: DUF4340 domain-containing protein [Planctomycetes bacterium]|nr:DUF4340 domain-containing protein [Planctomycetota bacterium]MCP4771712.1 DUF4340 domain-containing protein [Planctomycetota bacterium]MCP4859988.1 DUF4340 domain-containing protein [Planctomycetota bacterium]
MTKRNNLLLVLVLLFWAAFLMVEKPWKGDAHQRTAAHVGLLFPKLQYQTEQIRRVAVSDGTESVTLQLSESGRWRVVEKQHPMDMGRLMMVVQNLSEINTIDVVSVNPEKHSVYGVAEGQGTRVQVFGENDMVLADWIAGSLRHQEIGAGQKPVMEFYMRDGRSDVVYLSGEAIHPPATPTTWCDTHFLAQVEDASVTAVERFDFTTSDSWRIERVPQVATDAWNLTKPTERPAMSYAGESLAFSITGLRAADVVGTMNSDGADDARYGFPQDRFIVSIGDLPFEFELGKPAPTTGQRFFRVNGIPYIYTISDYDVSQLRLPVQRLLDDSQD